LFLTITRAVEEHDGWFKLYRSASGQISTSPVMNYTASMRVLAYGCSADAIDDYVCSGEDTILEVVRRFSQAVIDVFGVLGCLLRVKFKDGQGCLVQSTVCTGAGRIIQLVGRVNTKATAKMQQLYLRQLHRMTCGYGIFILWIVWLSQ
jgi:hypothetical protein